MRQLISCLAIFSVFFVIGFAWDDDSTAKEPTAQNSPNSLQTGARSGQPLPRYTSLKATEVYMRRGPGQEHPVIWVYKRKNMPLEIIEEYDVWRRVRDVDGSDGWIKKTMLSNDRHVMVRALAGSLDKLARPLRAKPNPESPAIAQVEPGVLADLRRCPNTAWCEIRINGTNGWIERSALWGIYPTEIIN